MCTLVAGVNGAQGCISYTCTARGTHTHMYTLISSLSGPALSAAGPPGGPAEGNDDDDDG